MLFLSKVEEFIAAHGLPRPADGRMAVGLSGGADSVALLATLRWLGYECVALHANFHLRGDESLRDQRMAQQVAAKLCVPILTKDFDVEARRRATGESVEMACRELRYSWFREAMAQTACHWLAVAHHADDNVETLLLNLTRGTGLRGLAGMAPVRDRVVRPFLGVSKAEILMFVVSHQLPYVIDSSNLTNDYLRNRLRNIAIPTLNQSTPGATAGILRTMGCLDDDYAVMASGLRELRKIYVDRADGSISLQRLKAAEPRPAAVLFHLLEGRFPMAQVRKMLVSGSGARFGGAYINDHGRLRPLLAEDLLSGSADDCADEVELPEGFLKEEVGVGEFSPDRSARMLFLDFDAVPAEAQLRFRRWRRGDRIAPFGMKGTRLLSNLFSDAHWPTDRKAAAWVLTDGLGNILWVPGLRASRHYPVTASTHRILRFTAPLDGDQ